MPIDLVRFVVIPYLASECEKCHNLLEEEEYEILQKRRVKYLLCDHCLIKCYYYEVDCVLGWSK